MRSCSPLNRHRQILATLPLTAAVSAAITATSLLAPSVAMAQLEEVVVTARARTESLQDVPATEEGSSLGELDAHSVPRTRFVRRLDVEEMRVEVVAMQDHHQRDRESENDAGQEIRREHSDDRDHERYELLRTHSVHGDEQRELGELVADDQ